MANQHVALIYMEWEMLDIYSQRRMMNPLSFTFKSCLNMYLHTLRNCQNRVDWLITCYTI